MKTIITIAAIAALALSGCTVGATELITATDDTAQTTRQYEEKQDDLDEYDEAQLLAGYEEILAEMRRQMSDLMPDEDCWLYLTSPEYREGFWIGFFDEQIGFWSYAPDELRYILTDEKIQADVDLIINASCSNGM